VSSQVSHKALSLSPLYAQVFLAQKKIKFLISESSANRISNFELQFEFFRFVFAFPRAQRGSAILGYEFFASSHYQVERRPETKKNESDEANLTQEEDPEARRE
jgi:hypothetical protein